MHRLSIVKHFANVNRENTTDSPVKTTGKTIGEEGDTADHSENNSEFVLAANQSSLFNRRIASGHSQSRADHSTSVAESDNKARSMRMTQTSLTSFEQVGQWLHHGKVSNLEILILEGKSHSIEERDDVRERSRDIHPAARDFIALIPRYKEQVDALLEAIVFGDERTVRETIHYERCILARHPLTLATTVHLAVIHNHPKILQLILSYPHAPLHSKDMEGRTPLHYAAAMAGTFIDSDPKCYDMLMDRNANENIADHEGYTPLNFYRTPTLIDIQQIRGLNQYPVIGGDDIDHMISERNVTALKALILSGDYSKANIEERVYPPASRDLAQFMANLNMRLEAIREAIRDDDFATMKQLLDSTDFATARDEFGRSSLHLAVLHGRERMVRYLLLLFPDCVDALDKGGRSALHYATSLSDGEKRKMMTRLLFRAGAKSSAPSSGLIQTLPEKIEDTARYISQQRVEMGKCVTDSLPSMAKLFPLPMAQRASFLSRPKNNDEFYGPMDTNGIDGKEKRRTRITKAVAESGHISSPSLSPTKTAPNQEYRHQNGQAPTTKQHKHRRGHRHPQSEEKIRRQDSHRRLTRTSTTYDWNSKRKSIAAPHTATHKAMFFQDDDEEDIDAEVEDRLLDIDFDKKEYSGLEQLQFEGKSDEIWKVVKKHLGNEKLYKYLHRYRQAQSRLNSAFAAIDENDLKKLKTLLDEELVQTRDSRGLAVLHLAVLKERHEIVEHIAYSFPKLIDIADHAGRTAAHYAAPQQNAIYDTLLEAGANIYLPDKNGFTASRYRNSPDQMVLPLPPPPTLPVDSQATATVGNFKQRMSIDELNNFDPDAPNDSQIERWLAVGDVQHLEQIVLDGRSHLLMDKSSMNLASTEFMEGISQYQAKIDAIHKAVEDGDVRRVKSLIDRPSLSTARDRNGMTPLHKALLYGQTNTVRYLLGKYPQCVNCTDHAGRTPLHYAAADPNGEHMIKVLQKSGGDAFIEDKLGHTPFYYRTHGKRLNIRTLKDNAVINQLISGQLNRPLLQDLEEDISDWIHTGNVGKLEELVLNGYADLLLGRTHSVDDPDAINFLEVLPQYQAKIQAIHKAIEQGNLRAVKLLTDRKKLALCRDGRGLAPLHKAIVFGQADIAKYLIRNYPQSVNAMDQNKRTPLHYAAALRDGGYLYKLMRKAGADPNIFDCNGRPAKYYLKYPGEINLERMRLDTKQALKQVLHNRVAPSYLETNIQQWLREGNLGKLDQLVLSGCGDLLLDKKTNNPDTSIFLQELPHLLKTIDSIHKCIKEADLEGMRNLMNSKRLALARNRHGCTPLHTAIIYEQTEIIRYIAANFPSVLSAPDYNKRTAMHYAAAARDGGHYLKILGKAGADPMAVDNEGRTPDYYRRNAVFDLKLLKERDDDIDALHENLLDDQPIGDEIDSPPSPESGSIYSSGLDSGRVHDDHDDLDRNKFERLLQEKLDMPTSDNGLYLARTVAPVLTKALAEVLLKRPANPIAFISDWLIHYNEEDVKHL